jgi:hypothetical protein
LALSALVLQGAAPASAQPRCSERSFSAAGAPGILYFLGRRHAREAWSAKVRSELGEAYASWGRARESRIDCVFTERRFRCSASGIPCRAFTLGSAAAAGTCARDLRAGIANSGLSGTEFAHGQQ